VNHGVFAVQRLDGNIGYIDLRGVADPDAGGNTIAAAMQLISSTYALILDLRRNGGGSPDGAAFWCSYLLPPGTHLNDIYEGETGETRQFWSMPYVPGARYLERPVYVLTSARTFSGGEDIAYNLQAQGRAQVVGETTGGGAHPTRGVRISPTLMLTVPHARSVNPVTGTNWEGTGVIPDIPVPADQARDAAWAMALRQVITDADRLGDVPPPIRDEALSDLNANKAAERIADQVVGAVRLDFADRVEVVPRHGFDGFGRIFDAVDSPRLHSVDGIVGLNKSEQAVEVDDAAA